MDSPRALRLLTIGNVVSLAISLYRRYLKVYFGIALRSSLWGLAAFSLALLGVAVNMNTNEFSKYLAIIIPAWLVFFLYGSARYQVGLATITRLAYGDLTDQMETVEIAERFTRSRQWPLLWTAFLTGFIFWVSTFLVMLFIIIILIIFAVVVLMLAKSGSAMAEMIGSWIVLVAFGFGIVSFLWISLRLYLSEVPLAIELQMTPLRSIKRSWKLTQKGDRRLMGILGIAFLIVIPIQILSLWMLTMVMSIIFRVLSFTPSEDIKYIIAWLIIIIVFHGANILIAPFFQALRAVIYLDLQNRREGADLSVRDR
jgi:hypothetical protein